MNKRFETLLSLIVKSEFFADVGCDHGYIAKAVLDKGLANMVYITDISKPSLEKAIKLLSNNHEGRFKSYLTDGLDMVPYASQVLIAGMGGEEIIKILKKSAYKPEILILQPMKNPSKVRQFLHCYGYGLKRDFMFYAEGKYYDTMVAELNFVDNYNQTEEDFGRENLQGNCDFVIYVNRKIKETEELLKNEDLNEDSKTKLIERLKTLKGLNI